MAISKVTLNGVTQMDVTQKTVTANKMLNGITSLKNDGTDIEGDIPTKTSSNLTVSGATVTAPAGYYESDASKSVASMTLPTAATSSAASGFTSKATISRSTSDQYINIPTGYNSAGAYYKISAVANGTAGTPTATKGTVSSNSVTVTPSVTNTAGYISGGTKTGTAVTVSASELVSGTKSITSSGTTDVTNYASASVAAGSVTAPSTISGTGANINVGQDTLSLGKTISVTPTVTTAGYITSGTAKNVTVSLSASVNIRHSSDLTADGATVIAPAGYYSAAASASVASGTAGTPVATKGVANLGIGLWESGSINAITGATADNNYRIRLTDYIEITNEIQIASDSASAEYALRIYKADYSYVETEVVWHGDTMNLDEYLSTNFASDYSTFKYFKLIARYTDDRTISSGAVATLGGLINISKNKITITPSVTNTTGYITGGTETGTPVAVSASELVSGTKIVNAYGTSNVANYENVFVGVPLITGTFTGTSAGATDISIPYTGNGYPIIIMIYPTEGPFNESTGDFYNLIANQAAASIVGIKARMDVAPEYGSNVTQNHMVLSVTQKNSSSSATSYAASRVVSYMYQNSDSTGAGVATLLRLKDYTTMSVYIRGSSGYGFAQNIEWTYKIIYSE